MLYKFVEMLYMMYGEGYSEQIEVFAEAQKDKDISQNELFINWAQFIKHSSDFD